MTISTPFSGRWNLFCQPLAPCWPWDVGVSSKPGPQEALHFELWNPCHHVTKPGSLSTRMGDDMEGAPRPPPLIPAVPDEAST